VRAAERVQPSQRAAEGGEYLKRGGDRQAFDVERREASEVCATRDAPFVVPVELHDPLNAGRPGRRRPEGGRGERSGDGRVNALTEPARLELPAEDPAHRHMVSGGSPTADPDTRPPRFSRRRQATDDG
jgi:hypothetical protein